MKGREVQGMRLSLLFLFSFNRCSRSIECLSSLLAPLVDAHLMSQLANINAFFARTLIFKFFAFFVTAQEESHATNIHLLIVSQCCLFHNPHRFCIGPYLTFPELSSDLHSPQ